MNIPYKKLALTGALSLGALGFAFGQVTSDPVGFVSKDLGPGFTTVGLNMVKPAVFAGNVSSSSANEVTVEADVDFGTLLGDGSYYIEVTSGAIEGDRIDVASGTGSTLTLNNAAAHNTLSDGSAVSGSIAVREHFTFADITERLGTENIRSGTDAGNFVDGDQILLMGPAGFQANNFIEGNWFTAGFDPADDRILAPASGFLYHRNAGGLAEPPSTLSMSVVGAVRTNDIVIPLSPGFQLVSTGYPMDISPADLGINTQTGFVGAEGLEDTDQSDAIIIRPEGAFQQVVLFTDDQWYNLAADFANVTEAGLFGAGDSVILRLAGTEYEPLIIDRPF
ncbi:MAG: hypothetical protein WD490_10500 [Opitutales bacterium]